jgi:ribosomal protein L11 methylase PrmA
MTDFRHEQRDPSSFRDPSGFLFYRNDAIYRSINHIYKENYDQLMHSGLYKTLIDAELLIPHEEVGTEDSLSGEAYKIIKPEQLPFISYPYEWCFSQLKDAALTTLSIQKQSLEFGMALKDCSAYNIQFSKGKPVLIDTLSFEKYREGRPWVAYRQFCQHFLAPLALMNYTDIRLNQLLRIHMDGIPLDMVSKLLPFRTRFHFGLFSHIHLHAKSQKHFADKSAQTTGGKMSHTSMLGLIDSLETAVRKMKWTPKGTEWNEYYDNITYSTEAFDEKKQLVSEFLDSIHPASIWDLGSNTGVFSRIASKKGIQTISFDIDPACVERNYLEVVSKKETHILPLFLDLTNPSPAIGWQHLERKSIVERGPVDTVLALALVHHLAISNNLPLHKLAVFFDKICHSLIIEFVPKNDPQVQILLSSREDIFPEYTQNTFEESFKKYYAIQKVAKIRDTQRTLYLMVKDTSRS